MLIKSKLRFIVLPVTIIGALLTSIPAAAASATYPYNPPNLISDSTFTNTSTMNEAAIQNFLTNEGGGLKSLSFTESCNPTTPIQPYSFTYYPNCGNTVSAATIIYDASRAYSINPQVILATMQKEQSLVTTPDPTVSQLNCAMGYASCAKDNSFFSQVDNATWQFRLDIEQMDGNSWWGYSPGSYVCKGATSLYSTGLLPGSTVTFANPYYSGDPAASGTGARTITIANAATAALYCYTPYVGPFSQTGYSGSYNFVQYFEQWFGDTQGSNIIPADDSVYRLYNSQTGDHLLTASASEADTYAEAGWHYDGIVAHTDTNGTVPVYRLYNGSTGQHYYTTSTTTVSQYQANGWASDGAVFSGDSSGAPVWELQNGNQSFVTDNVNEFSAYLGAGWHSHGILYYELTDYAHPVWRLFNSQNGDHLLTASATELTAYLSAGWHSDGVVFQASASGVPVYRLYNGSTGQHYYTTSTTTVSQYQANGWASDGAVFSVSNTGTPVYLLTQGTHSFTTANTSELAAYQSAGWQNQGVAFSTNNLVAARRLYQPSTGSHMTVSSIDDLWYYSLYGWYDDGVQFYVSATYGTWVWQLYSPSQNSYFYTTTQSELNAYTSAGWQNQGVAFSAPPGGIEGVSRLYNSSSKTHILIGSEQNQLQNYLNSGWSSDGVIFNAYDSSQL